MKVQLSTVALRSLKRMILTVFSALCGEMHTFRKGLHKIIFEGNLGK